VSRDEAAYVEEMVEACKRVIEYRRDSMRPASALTAGPSTRSFATSRSSGKPRSVSRAHFKRPSIWKPGGVMNG
jgi:hypothetical protein